ncbi:MFS transporter [Roseibium sp. SCPC15]|uniref:MFS transporter n=1 Tax=Roseibium sp. SCP15 TaxID=3141376 RepID=UPI00333C6F72
MGETSNPGLLSLTASPAQGSRLDPRVWLVLLSLYVAQAIPIYLVAAALPPIFRSRGIDLVSIGSIGILMLPWILKFLWAPYVDRFYIRGLGRRRSWIVPMQLVSVTVILFLSTIYPEDNLGVFFPVLMLLALCAATQDIATDGYAVEHLPKEQQPLGNAIQGGSVAAGVSIGGSLTLFVYDAEGWSVALKTAAILSAFCLLPILFVSENTGLREKADEARAVPSLRAFLKRPHALALLGFALIFRLPEGLVKGMEQAFLVDQGFSLSQIGLISGGAAACVGLGGSAIAVVVIKSFGLRCFFWTIGLSRTVCFAGYAAFAWQIFGTSEPALAVLIGLSAFNTFIRYMELVGLYTAFMRFASLEQAGTDFTFLSCSNLLVYMIGSMAAGVIGQAFGFSFLFSLAVGLSVVSILIAMRCLPWSISQPENQKT